MQEWKVTFDGGFFGQGGSVGKEIAVKKSFLWNQRKWMVPAVYLCKEGIVVDYVLEADPDEVKAFIETWNLTEMGLSDYTREQQEQLTQEHPLNAEFSGRLILNGEAVCTDFSSCTVNWLPKSLWNGEMPQEEAGEALRHYELDEARAWTMIRTAYEIKGMKKSLLQSLSVRMVKNESSFFCPHFTTRGTGGEERIVHPLTGEEYVLRIHEIEKLSMDEHAFGNPQMEFPTNYQMIGYSIEPEVSNTGFMLMDTAEGDAPRMRLKKGKKEPHGASSVFVMARKSEWKTACSAMHFEPVEEVEWCPVFRKKMAEDLVVELIGD